MQRLLDFLNRLEEKGIYYRLNKVRMDAVMVEIAVPGERWEIEFMGEGWDDDVQIEKFRSDGHILGSEEIEQLFLQYSD